MGRPDAPRPPTWASESSPSLENSFCQERKHQATVTGFDELSQTQSASMDLPVPTLACQQEAIVGPDSRHPHTRNKLSRPTPCEYYFGVGMPLKTINYRFDYQTYIHWNLHGYPVCSLLPANLRNWTASPVHEATMTCNVLLSIAEPFTRSYNADAFNSSPSAFTPGRVGTSSPTAKRCNNPQEACGFTGKRLRWCGNAQTPPRGATETTTNEPSGRAVGLRKSP
eukprot:GHVU01156160.1.p1 GENE.GHVU01156160.1~~GHVU01156160.1.p1  ORF type:complete len:225 (-),score=7.63 GHVU01156160.1:165-839(-)